VRVSANDRSPHAERTFAVAVAAFRSCHQADLAERSAARLAATPQMAVDRLNVEGGLQRPAVVAEAGRRMIARSTAHPAGAFDFGFSELGHFRRQPNNVARTAMAPIGSDAMLFHAVAYSSKSLRECQIGRRRPNGENAAR